MLKADVTLLLQKRYFIITSSNSILNIDTFFVTNYTQKTHDLLLTHVYLTHYVPVLPSYRNQSIDLLCKSIDWFLYEGNTGTYWVK